VQVGRASCVTKGNLVKLTVGVPLHDPSVHGRFARQWLERMDGGARMDQAKHQRELAPIRPGIKKQVAVEGLDDRTVFKGGGHPAGQRPPAQRPEEAVGHLAKTQQYQGRHGFLR
jgi:hypothetical protein